MEETNPNQQIELDEMNVIIRIPTDAATIDLTAHILDEDQKVINVTRHFTVDEVRRARQDFLDNVDGGDDYDARYVLTEEGKRYLEELKAERNSQ